MIERAGTKISPEFGSSAVSAVGMFEEGTVNETPVQRGTGSFAALETSHFDGIPSGANALPGRPISAARTLRINPVSVAFVKCSHVSLA